VEDDPGSAELIRLQLEGEGFAVVHATSAEAALELAATQPFSLITLDVWLPGADRSDFLSQITQIEGVKGIPVVIISIAADRDKCIALGAAAVLEKPVLRQALYETLVELGLFPTLDGSTLKILVVDDDPEAVELIAERLAGLAGTVLRASGGREAIELTRSERPDLILLDVFMPVVNGFDVVDALHEQADTAHIPIVVVTAKQMTVEDRAKLHGRVATILDKGDIDRDRFTLEVRRAMSRRARAA
jgi:CheY-like chemotaxis protein